MPLIRKAFKRLHYPVDIIAQCVRGYPIIKNHSHPITGSNNLLDCRLYTTLYSVKDAEVINAIPD
ncbi:conserved hypothetical protein [Xenorhabdus nematophila F1]|uniref:Uncharacterized protein n=1 Tax=Xenorhabdus nematophila (strain ATCC 19061 / DSM 3370 / CCUG 14189 / LMG 1036 / NCIMB 9965 / AN6) TaxID=406817 RepID=D3VGG6_XENNA|nr:hypothetical protein XNC1_2343 [Xenorhabdus nematophila ATCC 19061]CCW32406.1 conserved hypothetical protein [Xenorhabdus nematophila F1]